MSSLDVLVFWVADIDGNQPGPVWVQVYRNGTFNGVQGIAVMANRWEITGLTVPADASKFGLYVEGNVAGSRLAIRNPNIYNRIIRIYWMPVSI